MKNLENSLHKESHHITTAEKKIDKNREIVDEILKNCEFFDTISLEEATKISQAIETEKSHMITRSPEEILKNFSENGGIVAKIHGKLAGAINLTLVDEKLQIFERGGLFVFPEFRNHKIAKKLIRKVNEKFSQKSIFSVTNVDKIKHINSQDDNQHEIPREHLSEKLLEIIEQPNAEKPTPLLKDDSVFVNNTLKKQLENNEI